MFIVSNHFVQCCILQGILPSGGTFREEGGIKMKQSSHVNNQRTFSHIRNFRISE